MAGPYGSPQQPITLAEVELQVATYQDDLKKAEYEVQVAERDLRQARDRRDTLKRRVEAWQGFAKTLKELP